MLILWRWASEIDGQQPSSNIIVEGGILSGPLGWAVGNTESFVLTPGQKMGGEPGSWAWRSSALSGSDAEFQLDGSLPGRITTRSRSERSLYRRGRSLGVAGKYFPAIGQIFTAGAVCQ